VVTIIIQTIIKGSVHAVL